MAAKMEAVYGRRRWAALANMAPSSRAASSRSSEQLEYWMSVVSCNNRVRSAGRPCAGLRWHSRPRIATAACLMMGCSSWVAMQRQRSASC
eukprot:scaffold36200_cov63-Phaeocystis_antarctica.AAC.13